jgi:hypothetical protein
MWTPSSMQGWGMYQLCQNQVWQDAMLLMCSKVEVRKENCTGSLEVPSTHGSPQSWLAAQSRNHQTWRCSSAKPSLEPPQIGLVDSGPAATVNAQLVTAMSSWCVLSSFVKSSKSLSNQTSKRQWDDWWQNNKPFWSFITVSGCWVVSRCNQSALENFIPSKTCLCFLARQNIEHTKVLKL